MRPQSFQTRLLAVAAGELINKGCVILAFAHLARTLDPARYGEIEWALSITMVCTLFADAGLATWAAARVAARPEETPALIARAGWLRLTLGAVAYAVLLAAAAIRGGSAGATLAVYGLVLFLAPISVQYVFEGTFQTRWSALGNALKGIVFLVAVRLLVGPGAEPWHAAVAEVLGAAALAACGLIILSVVFRMRVPALAGRRGWRSVLAQSWKLGASDVTWGVHSYTGVIVLGYLSMPDDTAWHSAGLRAVLALHTGVWLYLTTLLPNLVRLLRTDASGWTRLVEMSIRMTGWAGCLIALVGTIGAPRWLSMVFGPPFAQAAREFQMIVWIVPIAWLAGHVRYSLVAAQRSDRELQARLIGAGTTVLLTLLLVPMFHSRGAGLALLIGTIANGIAAWALARDVLPRADYLGSAAASAVGCLICLAGGMLIKPMVGDVSAALVAGATYAAAGLVIERGHAAELIRVVFRSRPPQPEIEGARS